MHFFHTKTETWCVFYAHTSSQLPRFKCPRATWGWWHPCGCSPLLRNQDPGPTAPFIQAGYLKPLCSALCMSYYLTKSSQLCQGQWYEEEADGQQGKWVSHTVIQHVRGRAGWNPLPHSPSLQHPHPLTPAYPGLCWASSGETQGHITAIPAHKKLLAQPSQVRSYAEACCIAPVFCPWLCVSLNSYQTLWGHVIVLISQIRKLRLKSIQVPKATQVGSGHPGTWVQRICSTLLNILTLWSPAAVNLLRSPPQINIYTGLSSFFQSMLSFLIYKAGTSLLSSIPRICHNYWVH